MCLCGGKFVSGLPGVVLVLMKWLLLWLGWLSVLAVGLRLDESAQAAHRRPE